ncbi:MAG: NAD-dependent epimerase/dehydratase family protein [Dehalococcoidia bacterium]
MNILVTGGSGFIGGHTVDGLVRAGHHVRVLDLKDLHRADVEVARGDITSMDDVARALKDIDVIYHIAAFSNIDMVKDNPLTTVESNIMGTACLLEGCRHLNIKRFVFASSVYVHDERGHLYTTCKLASEMLCRNYSSLYGLPYTILRYGTAYGPRSRNADVVSIFVDRALRGQNLIVRGGGKQSRHFIYVDDLVEANVLALKPVATNRTYVVVGPQPVAVETLAQMVKEMAPTKIEIEHEPSREDDYLGEVSGIDLPNIDLGWKPQIDIREGLRRYIEWYRENMPVR